MHRTYLFDFDGTLVDSMPCWGEKMLNILRHEGITPKPGLVSHIATQNTSVRSFMSPSLRRRCSP